MDKKEFNFHIAFFVATLVIIFFFGTQYIINIFFIEKPIEQDIAKIKGVEEVSLENKKNQINIEMTLNPNLDLYNTYDKIEKIAKEKVSKENFIVKFVNKENQFLEDIYHEMHYAIYEGIYTKKFVIMQERLEEIVRKHKIDNLNLWVDDKRVLLQLDHNDKSYYKNIVIHSLGKEGGIIE
ncbi:MAG: hypothetical protein ACOCQR_03250 [bacterium]